MKKILIISFDLIRTGEVEKALAIASLMAYLKADRRYGNEFAVSHKTFNMWDLKNTITDTFLEHALNPLNIETFDTIAVSCYVWNEYLINPLLKKLRLMGLQGKIVLGGAQISYSDNEKLKTAYPEGDIFINCRIVARTQCTRHFLRNQFDLWLAFSDRGFLQRKH